MLGPCRFMDVERANNDIEWQVEGEDISTKQWYLLLMQHWLGRYYDFLSSIPKDKMR
ncbi:hypothetical protein OK016_26220 [Vibrio chagasii]|nr:hypothetical protein [Vibrio chagasii]